MRTLIVVVVTLVASIHLLATDSLTGRVVMVIDGNTLSVISNDELYTIVLADIDCPELDQAFGDRARQYLEQLTLKKEIVIRIQGKDRKGNYVGVVLLNGSIDLRSDLLTQGLAWANEKTAPEDIKALEQQARESGIGLWRDDSPTPPWIFRRQQAMATPKAG